MTAEAGLRVSKLQEPLTTAIGDASLSVATYKVNEVHFASMLAGAIPT